VEEKCLPRNRSYSVV